MKRPKQIDPGLLRALAKEILRPDQQRDASILRAVRSIPKGKVAGYAQVAAAAGYPLHHRLVVRLLQHAGDRVPWWRVLGADGAIRLKGAAALEQRRRLEAEGVAFHGKRVDLALHKHRFELWRD